MDEIERGVIHDKFRHPVLGYFTGEGLLILYSQDGISRVITEIQKPRQSHAISCLGSFLHGKGGDLSCSTEG
jgi:hypothetical protein